MTLEVRYTDEARDWIDGLRDRVARRRVFSRLDLLADGHFGDWRPVGEGVGELRIHAGPGYRLYFARRGDLIVVILLGGDKSSQDRDIAKAKRLARDLDL